jgi:vancomycin resistance protein VanW
LKGEIRADRELDYAYHVTEIDHRFLLNVAEGQYYRSNSIWRIISERKTGKEIKDELICSNFSRMKYQPSADVEIEKFGFVERERV